MTRDTEHRRQQGLVRRLLMPGACAIPPGLRPGRLERGLSAYDTHAAGAAERSLAGTYPTVQAMLGMEPFGRLSQVLWTAHPPLRGDLAAWGDELPQFLANDASLDEWPYLSDCARLDRAVSRCASSADAVIDLSALARLGDTDADRLRLDLAAGATVIDSLYPVVTLWHAHRAADVSGHLSAARAALAEGRAECAFVWRAGWRPQVSLIDTAAAQFVMALCDGASLGEALGRAGEAFAFEPWLVSALQDGWLTRVHMTE